MARRDLYESGFKAKFDYDVRKGIGACDRGPSLVLERRGNECKSGTVLLLASFLCWVGRGTGPEYSASASRGRFFYLHLFSVGLGRGTGPEYSARMLKISYMLDSRCVTVDPLE